MTGKELVLYILENNLENEPVFKDGKFIGFITAEEAAVKKDVGIATIKAFVDEGWLEGYSIGGILYIPAAIKTNIHRKAN